MMLQVLVEHLAAADNVVPEILRRRRNIAFLIPLQVKPALWNIIGYWEDFSYYKALRKADTAQLRFPFWLRPGRK